MFVWAYCNLVIYNLLWYHSKHNPILARAYNQLIFYYKCNNILSLIPFYFQAIVNLSSF